MPLLTRRALRVAIGRNNGWVILGSTSVAATDAGEIVDQDLYSSARDQHVRRRSVVAIVETADARQGERRLATGPPSTTGEVAVSPDFGGTVGLSVDYEIWDPDGPHPDEIDRLIDEALQEFCWYWGMTPLTMLPGGEVGDDLVLDGEDIDDADGNELFSATSVTTTLPEMEIPDEFTRRVIPLVAGASPGYLESRHIRVDPLSRGSWKIEALLNGNNAGIGPGDTRIVIWDLTNNVAIVDSGSPIQVTSQGWRKVAAMFTIPADCQRFAIRLQVETNTEVGEFAAIQLWETDQRLFSLSRRIKTKKHVGQVYEVIGDTFGQLRRQEWRGSMERRDRLGRGIGLILDPPPGETSLWFYENRNFPALTSAIPAATDDANETPVANEWIRAATNLKVYEYLARRDHIADPKRWGGHLVEAREELEIMQGEYGIEPMHVDDSPRPSRRATRRV